METISALGRRVDSDSAGARLGTRAVGEERTGSSKGLDDDTPIVPSSRRIVRSAGFYSRAGRRRIVPRNPSETLRPWLPSSPAALRACQTHAIYIPRRCPRIHVEPRPRPVRPLCSGIIPNINSPRAKPWKTLLELGE